MSTKKDAEAVFWGLMGWFILLAVSLGLSYIFFLITASKIAMWAALVVIGGTSSVIYFVSCFPEAIETLKRACKRV